MNSNFRKRISISLASCGLVATMILNGISVFGITPYELPNTYQKSYTTRESGETPTAVTGYASTSPYADADYKAAVGEEQAAADAKYLVDNNLIQLVLVDDESVVIEGVLDESKPLRIFFNEIPVGTYKPVLKKAALDAGYIQTSDNTIKVNESPGPVFASSTGVFFEKKIDEPVVATGYASTSPYAAADYKAAVGEEQAAADAKYLVDNNLIQLVLVDDESVVIEGVLDESDPLRIFFNEIPVGTYKPVLKKAALDAGYIQTSDNTIKVNESPDPVFASSTGVFFEKKIDAVKVAIKHRDGQYNDLVWNRCAQADGYAIYCQAPGESTLTLLTETTETSYVDTVKTAGFYFYRVYPFTIDKDGEKELGLSANYVYAYKALEPVLGISAKAHGKGIQLTWEKVAGAEEYVIYRRSPSDNAMTLHVVVNADATTWYDDTDVNGYYFYRIIPRHTYNGELYAASSKELASVYLDTADPLPAVQNLQVKNKHNRYNDLTWNNVPGADGYLIYRMAPNEEKLSFHAGNIRNGYTEEVTEVGYYFYRVIAFQKNADGTITVGPTQNYVFTYNPGNEA
ncbi:MAG TPA: hypothetical protein GX717_01360 [Clostridiaceae bacterium]|nr:hypothetical protein [Clostridiaceae bacterium]